MTGNIGAPGFGELFGRPPIASASAPGRVNLIGEHTDYSGGFVLPMAMPQRTRVELAPRSDRHVRAVSVCVDDEPDATYRLGDEKRRGAWIDYVQGVTAVLSRVGVSVPGFDARVDSDVPIGGGLASSAALLVALLRALRSAFGLALDDVRVAVLAQRAENELVGAPVGIMDPLAASLAPPSSALFVDTRSMEHEVVPFPATGALVVLSSGITHSHADGEYRVRRQECEEAAELAGVVQLRDLGLADLARVAALPAPLDRRARHVITENARVLSAVQAMRAGDLPALGALFDSSHASLRDDFEVSIPEIDVLVEVTRRQVGVFGARLTGGGFGGSVVGLAKSGEEGGIAERSAAMYRALTGRSAEVLAPPRETERQRAAPAEQRPSS